MSNQDDRIKFFRLFGIVLVSSWFVALAVTILVGAIWASFHYGGNLVGAIVGFVVATVILSALIASDDIWR